MPNRMFSLYTLGLIAGLSSSVAAQSLQEKDEGAAGEPGPSSPMRPESSSSVNRTSAPEERFVSFGVEGGLTYWTERGPIGTANGIGLALVPGYNFGLRGSVEFLPWLALDLRGLLTHNVANSLVNGGAFTTIGGFAAARFTLQVPNLRPYALVGFGAHHLSASGDQTQLLSGTFVAFQPGFGLAVPAGKNLEIGVEYLFNVLLAETLSTNKAASGGDPSTISFFVQYRLPL